MLFIETCSLQKCGAIADCDVTHRLLPLGLSRVAGNFPSMDRKALA